MELNTAKFCLALVALVLVGLELAMGRFGGWGRRGDGLVDAFNTVVVPSVLHVSILTATAAGLSIVAPSAFGVLGDLPFLVMFAAFVFGDDLTQYLWHRLTHNVPWLYGLHRAHHSASYLSVRVVYRNSLIYYLFMPSLWITGALLYLGMGRAYPVYVLMKMVVITGAHSSVPWDAPLYRWRVTRPLMWVVERVISTPATHSAHHGLHASDGVTHYKGNFGNFLFIWDVCFGTAHITRRRPEAYGIEGLEDMGPIREVLWPFPWPR